MGLTSPKKGSSAGRSGFSFKYNNRPGPHHSTYNFSLQPSSSVNTTALGFGASSPFDGFGALVRLRLLSRSLGKRSRPRDGSGAALSLYARCWQAFRTPQQRVSKLPYCPSVSNRPADIDASSKIPLAWNIQRTYAALSTNSPSIRAASGRAGAHGSAEGCQLSVSTFTK